MVQLDDAGIHTDHGIPLGMEETLGDRWASPEDRIMYIHLSS